MSGRGWDSHVYRTDVQPEQFCGFHFDDTGAQTWITKQKEGTYEVSTDKPSRRTPRLDRTPSEEEEPGDD